MAERREGEQAELVIGRNCRRAGRGAESPNFDEEPRGKITQGPRDAEKI